MKYLILHYIIITFIKFTLSVVFPHHILNVKYQENRAALKRWSVIQKQLQRVSCSCPAFYTIFALRSQRTVEHSLTLGTLSIGMEVSSLSVKSGQHFQFYKNRYVPYVLLQQVNRYVLHNYGFYFLNPYSLLDKQYNKNKHEVMDNIQ